jgi:hypothetical protein
MVISESETIIKVASSSANSIRELGVVSYMVSSIVDNWDVLSFAIALILCSVSLASTSYAISSINLWNSAADNPISLKELTFLPILVISGIELCVVFQLVNLIIVGFVVGVAWKCLAISIVSVGLCWTSHGLANNTLWKSVAKNPTIMGPLTFLPLLAISALDLLVLGHLLIMVFIFIK